MSKDYTQLYVKLSGGLLLHVCTTNGGGEFDAFLLYIPSPTVVQTYRLVLLESVPALPRLPVAPLPPFPLLTPSLPPLPLTLPRPLVLTSSLEPSLSPPEAPPRLEEESLSLAVASLSSRLASSSLLLLLSLSDSSTYYLHFQLQYQSLTNSQLPGQHQTALPWSSQPSYVRSPSIAGVNHVEIRASK